MLLYIVLLLGTSLPGIAATIDIQQNEGYAYVDYVEEFELPVVDGGTFIEFPVVNAGAYFGATYSFQIDVLIGRYDLGGAVDSTYPHLVNISRFEDGGFGVRGGNVEGTIYTQLIDTIHYVYVRLEGSGYSDTDTATVTQVYGIYLDGPGVLQPVIVDAPVENPEPGTMGMVGLILIGGLVYGRKTCRKPA